MALYLKRWKSSEQKKAAVFLGIPRCNLISNTVSEEPDVSSFMVDLIYPEDDSLHSHHRTNLKPHVSLRNFCFLQDRKFY
jgi:hypothetical protein